MPERHPHDLVGGHPDQLVLLLAVEPHHKEGDTVLGERLPGLDKVHLGLQQVQVLHVGVRLHDFLPQLKKIRYKIILGGKYYLKV